MLQRMFPGRGDTPHKEDQEDGESSDEAEMSEEIPQRIKIAVRSGAKTGAMERSEERSGATGDTDELEQELSRALSLLKIAETRARGERGAQTAGGAGDILSSEEDNEGI